MSDEPEKVELETPDMAAQKRAAFDDLFPGVLADGVLDATRLGELLDASVTAPTDGRERFGLMWAGKQDAVRSLLTPSRGTLVPELDKSIGFDTARNVFIEGDNLEVLKLLQKAYNDRVKLIYIDPPYNTGGDEFIYPDDFSDTLRAYLQYTGQVDADGNRMSAGSEVLGRRHSRWLSMIYPRLVLARNLLRQDGVIFVAIDDNEVANLRLVMDEVFGAENFVATMVWEGGRKNDAKFVSVGHDYMLAYARDVEQLKESDGRWRVTKPQIRDILDKLDEIRDKHGDDPDAATTELRAFLSPLKRDISKLAAACELVTETYPEVASYFPELARPLTELPGQRYNRVDARGAYRLSDLSWPGPGGHDYDLIHPNGKPVRKPIRGWRYDEAAMQRLVDEDRVDFKADESGVPEYKRYLHETEFEVMTSVFYRTRTKAAQDLADLMGDGVFDHPKDIDILGRLIEAATSGEDLVLDFFAGSGTTAHAVLKQNAEDGGQRRFLAVQLPEPATSTDFAYISDITRARIVAAMKELGAPGFRSFRLESSVFHRDVGAEPTDLFDLSESTLRDPAEDSTAIAGEVLLKDGIPLDARWSESVAGDARVIEAGGVAVVLSLAITDEVVRDALAMGARVVVFLEDGFAGADAVKANAVTNAKNLGITLKTV
jgi:adenine-specific DNA-methyltransferase